MADTQHSWASRESFERVFLDQGTEDPTAYYGHGVNGYQRVRHALLEAVLLRHRAALPGQRMLDLGCGVGDLTARLVRVLGLPTAHGTDFVASLVREAHRHHPGLRLCASALPGLPYGDGRFDLVVASEVLYYLTEPARHAALREVARVLAPGGVFLFSSALGGRYFSVDSARALVAGEFEVLHQQTHHMRGYHTLLQPFFLILRLGAFIRHGQQPVSERRRRILNRWAPVLRSPPLRLLFAPLQWLATAVFRSTLLARFYSRLGRLIAPAASCSNITLLCRKRG